MPVKIKHKQLGTIETVAYVNWSHHYNQHLWDVLEMWDVGKIYNVQGKKPIYQSTVDKHDFLEAMKHPVNQNALRFDPLPDIGKRLPIKTPKAYAATIIKPIIISALQVFKKDYIKYTIIGVLILVVWFFIYPLMKHLFPKFDLP